MKKIKILSLIGTLALSMSLVGVSAFAQTPSTTTAPINVANYGATGTDLSDDTASIQKAINAGASVGREVDIPVGNYYINPDAGLNLPSNTTLNFDNGARLIALPSAKDAYDIVKIFNVSNVKITGSPTIIGERNKHIGNSGEWGMGIDIKSSNNVYIENASISNCWGDGIYIGEIGGSYQPYNKDITIKNTKLDNNRRQGISVISAINLDINSPTITNTNGTDPQSGIDFEPNNPNDYMQNIIVTNPIIQNNAKDGLHFWFGFNKGTKNVVSINIENSSGIKNNKNQDINFYKTGLGTGEIMVDGKDLYLSGSPVFTTAPSTSDLQKQIDDLTAQNATLQNQVKSLQSTNDKLSAKLANIQNILNQ